MMYVRDVSPPSKSIAAESSRPVWVGPEPLPARSPRLHDDPLLHALLARRAADPAAAAEFLDERPRPAPDPLLLPGMTEAAARIAHALRHDEQIGLFGDYDTDGVTSTALLTHALRAARGGAQPVAVRLPRRQEGYGLSVVGVEELAADGAEVLLAVDCGSRDHAAVARARELGLDVVILDHHRLLEAPPAGAIVASAQLREDAPYRTLSAAGLAYLLAAALAQEGFDVGGGLGQEPVGLLDLAMIGLVGDVSSLTGVNRALVRDGLRQLRATPRPGLRALLETAGTDPAKVTSEVVAFQISPRLNAPGRLGDPQDAYELLLTWDLRRAARLAEAAQRANQKRKLLQDRVLRETEELLAAHPALLERRVLVVGGQEWEPGIVGLAASKLAERYDRPAVVLTISGNMAHGSARSVVGFDITAALSAASNLLLRHGGHERAAGLALETSHLPAFQDALEEAVRASDAPLPGPPRLMIEAELEPARLRLDTVRELQKLGPFGEGNPVPLLRVSRLPIRGYRAMGRENQHLKVLTDGPAGQVDAVLWGGSNRSHELVGARHVDLVGNLEANIWNGTTRVQLRLADFRRADA
jgi:single-stranded-DNA-specific exonuclease